MEHNPVKVAVVDMQPITPAIGGGRQRLLGLYHALGSGLRCTYIGSYDWPGERSRDQQLTQGLREITVPLSAEHHAAAAALSHKLGGRTVIDIAFPDQAHLSPDFLSAARAGIGDADVAVFSHPWCFPPLAAALRPRQPVVYDAQNVESVLRMSMFDGLPRAQSLLRRVAEVELALCTRADMVLACSHDDAASFHRIYGTPWDRLRIVPNGILALDRVIPSRAQRAAAKRELGVKESALVLFLGSGYGPNNVAARFVAERLASQLPGIGFAIVGGCGEQVVPAARRDNVYAPGVLDDKRKNQWLTAADIAVNPMATGSGTCIKMFDYMAAGIPVIATAIGARGILRGPTPSYVEARLDAFKDSITQLLDNPDRRSKLSASARRLVEDHYAWERISPNVGMLIESLAPSPKRVPSFSVVIPTFERHTQLDALVANLDAQELRDFEVIIVDQSADAWDHADSPHAFHLRYVHSSVKGAVSARNLGGFLARGLVIAFTDDDCLPKPDWLENAQRWFREPSNVGIEGFIRSNHLDDPDWRPVTNLGCIGLGFMTANLFVRNEAFQQLGGFDIAFDHPHFREDTDFGWRLQELGRVPFAPDVEVFHPAQPRSVERESSQERGKFFANDALLLQKHPSRYAELFLAEAHYRQTEGFWDNLQRGLDLLGMRLPDWMSPYQRLSGAAHNGRLREARSVVDRRGNRAAP